MITLVSGFMRSGTTAMMRALQAGGLPCVIDSRRNAQNTQDGAYEANRGGLMEPHYFNRLHPHWPIGIAEGKAVKVVVPYLPNLAVHEYRVIFMRRDPEEIRQSYEGAFAGQVQPAAIPLQVDEALRQLRNRRDVLWMKEVWFRDLIENPKAQLRRLGLDIDIEAAAAAIDPSLYRFRIENLVVGL